MNRTGSQKAPFDKWGNYSLMGDFLYNLTDWLRSTFLVDWALWISDTRLSLLMVENFWAIPIVQVIHILAIAAAFGAALMINLRVLGKSGHGMTMAQTSKRYAPWMWWGLVVLLLTGLLMIAGEPIRELINAVFWFKMIFIIVLILWTIAFLKAAVRASQVVGSAWQGEGSMRLGAVLLLVLWCVIMACGRWIAYAPV